jgi:hypothetical protein
VLRVAINGGLAELVHRSASIRRDPDARIGSISGHQVVRTASAMG